MAYIHPSTPFVKNALVNDAFTEINPVKTIAENA